MEIKVKQHDITDCGAACLASIAAYFKLKLPVSRIRQLAGTDKKGTNVFGLITAAEKLNLTAKGVKGGMEALPQIPLPAIAHVILKNGLHHYVVVYKVKKKFIQIMDPADGMLHHLAHDEFKEIWSGVLVLIAPGNNFMASNEKNSNVKRFIFLLKPHAGILFQTMTGAILYTVLGLSTSIYIQKITDHVLVNSNKNLLNLMSIAMIILLFFQFYIGAAKSVLTLRTGQKIDAHLILGYYKHLMKLPQLFFDTMRVGEIISRINDAVKIRTFINDTAISILVNLFVIIFSFLLMYIYSWKLALILSAIIPFYLLIYIITNRLNKKRERKLMENSAELESQLVESLNAIKTIKQFGLEEFANTKTEMRFIRMLRTVYKSGLNSIFSGSTSDFTGRFFTILMLWIGSYFVIYQILTPGELLSFYALIGYFTSPAMALIGANRTIQNALIAADRLFEIMDLERETNENKSDLTPSQVKNIRFKNVDFTYGTRNEVFTNLSLNIPNGKITAIIGESGSGKTTIASLIQKLYPINAGQIYIGDYNLNHISAQSLRKLIGCVPQNLDLFAGNITENIAIGEFQPNMERILSICKQLGILEFIETLPSGFNTYLGENGATISGGQKQKIAIARALYRDPQVLILDEASSSLDPESESFVQSTIKALRDSNKTIIVIAHKLSSVIHADKIIVLNKGKLIEEGTHMELYHKKNAYFQLWKQQLPIEQ